ncbi:hypothetical protein WUBG_09317, partial [Wuchereria bancrofti]
ALRSSKFRQLSDKYLLARQLSLGGLFGAWFGAFVIPFDWDRWWQRWPIPCVLGAVVGGILGCLTSSYKNSFFLFGKATKIGKICMTSWFVLIVFGAQASIYKIVWRFDNYLILKRFCVM